MREFVDTLDASALNLVVKDVGSQARHDNLPKAYEFIKSVLLNHE